MFYLFSDVLVVFLKLYDERYRYKWYKRKVQVPQTKKPVVRLIMTMNFDFWYETSNTGRNYFTKAY